ncbi:hypothetical protein ONZ45_g2366 [Pleurotus djamor]|nr:hypothetical protein ONZ45_g2366 [Pleurotus djamor]
MNHVSEEHTDVSPYTPPRFSPTDTLDKALADLERLTKPTKEILNRRIYVNKALIDGFATLIPVSIFVASVQGQVVASTLESNGDSVSVAANWFGFNGLVLDILGTAFGSMRLLSLQRSTRGAERNLALTREAHDFVKDQITSIKVRLDKNPDSATLSQKDIQAVHEALVEYQDLMMCIDSLYRSAFPSLLDLRPVNIIPARGVLNWATKRSSFIKGGFKRINVFLEDFVVPQVRRPRSTIPDQVPIAVMAFGIVFLLLSVILQAIATQFRRVWIGCVILTGIVCLYASPGIMDTDQGHPNHRERNLREKIKTLRGKLGQEEGSSSEPVAEEPSVTQ